MQRNNPLSVIDDYLRSRFVYVPENIETIQTPEYMINGSEINGMFTGDCDDITTLHGALLTCLSYKVRLVAIRSELDNPNFDHVFLETFDNGDWFTCDITIPLGTTIEYFGRLTVQV